MGLLEDLPKAVQCYSPRIVGKEAGCFEGICVVILERFLNSSSFQRCHFPHRRRERCRRCLNTSWTRLTWVCRKDIGSEPPWTLTQLQGYFDRRYAGEQRLPRGVFPGAAAEVEDEEGDLDGWDDEDFEDFETLPCNLKYVVICLILPGLNGLLNGLLWPAYTLHFLNNGWPVVRAGLAQALGFSFRVLTQQMELAAGYWLIVPLGVIHLAFAVLGFIYFDQEWAVFAEILVVFTIDPTCSIEGLAFDTFGNSESQARQASSTVLSVYTIGNALACTVGGLAFDFYGWRGMAALHTICQSALLFMLAIQPSMRQSFMEVCFGAKELPETMEKDEVESSTRAQKNTDVDSGANGGFMAVLPGAVEEEHNPPDAGDLVVEEVGEGVDPDAHGRTGIRPSNMSRASRQTEVTRPGIRPSNMSRTSRQTEGTRTGIRPSNMSRTSRQTDGTHTGIRPSNMSRASKQTDGTHATEVSEVSKGTARTANTDRTMRTGSTGRSAHTPLSARPGRSRRDRSGRTARSSGTRATRGSAMTARSVLTALSRVTALSEAGQDFHHHFGTNLATMPHIVGRTGAKRVLRDEGVDFDEEGDKVEESISETAETKARSTKIPKDIRLPVLMIVLNCFTNTATYVIEYSTFALFFREVHNWNEATLAGVAQTAGDVMAAIMMQVIPFMMPDGYDPDEMGPCSRFWHSLTSQPYTITCVLVAWMVFNACLVSPWLPIAIVAQVFMGTSYVYSCKWSTDMSLFYSLGDSKVFLAIQVLCRNADSLGGGLGSIFGTYLFTVGPTVPFIFGTGFTTTVFLLYTVCFCARLGFGDDIETAEAKRARRLGKNRVSSWAADAPARKTQVDAAD
eukprot:symbB.v1.2.000087.t2/scaffold14.1/size489596/12